MKICRSFYAPEPPINTFGVTPRKLIDKFYSWLGFGTCLHPDMDDLEGHPQFVPGYMATVSIIHLDLGDRLRAFLSGKLYHVATTKTDVVVGATLARSRLRVLPPNYKA